MVSETVEVQGRELPIDGVDADFTVENRFSVEAIKHLRCLACGAESWVHIPYSGVFCKECNLKLSLRNTNGDRGFIAEFNSSTCWSMEHREALEEQSETMKVLGTPGNYTTYW